MRNQKYLLTFIALFITSAVFAYGQSKTVRIRLVDGANGKPMGHERLLVFFGSSPHDVRMQKGSMDLHTDSKGEAALPLNEPTLIHLQVWVDFRTLCQTTPNDRNFAVEDILRDGEQTPNTCGRVSIPKTPGTLIVYARSSTLREKMAR